MQRSSPNQILTTHTGSLPRPLALVDMLVARNEHRLQDRAACEAAIRAAVADVVARQVEAGLTVVNDGEQSKIDFFNYRTARLSGFAPVDPASVGGPVGNPIAAEARDYPEFYSRWLAGGRAGAGADRQAPVLCCTGPIGWRDFSEVERDVANLKAATTGAPVADVFMSAISPATYAPPNLHYHSEEEYLVAIADALAREYKAIVDAGFILQIDAPDMTTTYRMRDIGFDEYRATIARFVELINHAVRGLPPDRIRVHVCWGADEAPHHRDPPLERIIDILLKLAPHGMTIAGANGRHAHEWRVWESVKLPPGKVIVPGVIDSTTNIIEHPEAVAERIGRYAAVLGLENLIAGVDCGFDTVARLGQVDTKIVWAKLRALAEGADIAARRLRR
ncbi:MAG: cobalamin-independent methionine synthase II family protein [Gammaproteobacteria bacterium]